MLAILDNLKMFQSVFNRFHLLCCRMFSRLFQFSYRIRSIIHWQAQTSLHLRYISSMYLEAIFSFYVFLYHFVGNSLFRLVCLGSFSDIIKRYFALFLAKIDFYADCAVRLFVGKQYYRLRVARYIHFDVRASRCSRKQIQPISSENIENCLVRFKSISSQEHIYYFRKPA